MVEKKEGIVLSLFVTLLILINLTSASFQLGTPNNSIQTNYEEGEKISGWINISFTNAGLNETFTDNFGNVVSLETILSRNTGYNITNVNNTINSSMQLLSINNSFTIPNILGNLSFKLNFSNQEIFSNSINLKSGENLTLKIIVSRKILEKESDLSNYKKDIGKYETLIQKKLNQTFNIDNLQLRIEEIKTEYSNAKEDSEYYGVMGELDNLRVPKSIIVSKSADNIVFAPFPNAIDLNVLASVSGGDIYGDEQDYIDGILFWTQSQIDSKIIFKEISINYGSSEEILFSYFDLSFFYGVPSGTYLFIKQMQGLEFENYYGFGQEENYNYLLLDEFTGNRIAFITTENVDFINVPLFISPALEEIPKTEIPEYTEGKTQMSVSKWIFFGLIIFLLLIITGVVYSIIQAWYDKKYENYLFPNRNNLYNLIIYINNSKKRGITDDEIIKNLKESKWTQEQIRYVMRKYAGKRTGMAKLFAKKTEMQNRINQQKTIGRNMSNNNPHNVVQKS